MSLILLLQLTSYTPTLLKEAPKTQHTGYTKVVKIKKRYLQFEFCCVALQKNSHLLKMVFVFLDLSNDVSSNLSFTYLLYEYFFLQYIFKTEFIVQIVWHP